jgi:DNA-binding Lrp family transcriptional regulator/hypoxanthine-guanine phosphoribosyltransferase
MPKDTFLEFKPIQKFINGVGKDVKKFFGREKGCIIGLGDDGFFYGYGLYQWISKKNKKINFTTMDNDGKGLEEEKVEGRKILIVDNDVISGKTYKRTMETMRAKKDKLKLKDIKFAVLCDRTGLADFSVEGYSAYAPWSLERLDGLDLKIIQALSEDGRRSFVEIAKEIKLSPVAVKNRVERLIADGVLKIQGLLDMGKVYSVSSHIEIEADSKTINRLISKFEKSPLVYHLVKVSGRYNLMLSIATPNLESVENFIAKEIRSEPGVKHIEVHVGELPIIPKVWNPPII